MIEGLRASEREKKIIERNKKEKGEKLKRVREA